MKNEAGVLPTDSIQGLENLDALIALDIAKGEYPAGYTKTLVESQVSDEEYEQILKNL